VEEVKSETVDEPTAVEEEVVEIESKEEDADE